MWQSQLVTRAENGHSNNLADPGKARNTSSITKASCPRELSAFLVINISKTLIRGGSHQSPALFAGLPEDDFLDLFS
jgi:hypothetical protein